MGVGKNIVDEAKGSKGPSGNVLTSVYCVPAYKDPEGCSWKVPKPWNTTKQAQKADKDGMIVWLESDDAFYLTEKGAKARLVAKKKEGSR